MKKIIFISLLLLLLPVMQGFSLAKTVYARTVGGNWSTDATWSTSSGGAANTTHPIAGDTVYLDANSGSVTVDAASACKTLTCTGYTNTLKLSADLTVSGVITFVAGMTFTPNTYTVNAGDNITCGGKSFYNLNFTTTNTYALATAVTVTNTLSVADGVTATISTSNITCASLTCTGSGIIAGASRTITMNGTGTWSSGGGAIKTNLTFNSAGTITVSGNVYYSTQTLTYTAGTMVLTGSTLNIAGSCTFTDATNTWNNINCSATATLTLSQTTTINGNLSVADGATLTLASNNISVKGNLTCTGTGIITGQTITMSGSGTWSSGGGAIGSNLTFNTAGTIIVSGDVYYKTGTLLYTAGTLTRAGSTLHFAGSCTFNDATNNWVNFDCAASTTLTLSQDIAITGNLTETTGNLTLASHNITVNGNLTINGTGYIAGQTITMNATGTWSSPGGGYVSSNLTFNTAGTITVSGNVYYETGTITWTAGTFTTTGSTLHILNSCTINTPAKHWNNVDFQAGTPLITLSADLYVDGNLSWESSTNWGGADIYVGGSVTGSGSSIYLGEASPYNRTIYMTGTGSFSNCYAAFNLNINTSGTITISGSNWLGSNAFNATYTYTAGTVNAAGSTTYVGLHNDLTFNAYGMTWGNIEVAGSLTLTLTSPLQIGGNLIIDASQILTFATSDIDVAGNLTLASGGAIKGTRWVALKGTGTWSGAGTVWSNLDINTAGTVTIGDANYQTGTFSYNAGTVNATGTLTIAGSCTLNLNNILLYNLTNTMASSTITLTAGTTLTVTHQLTLSNSSIVSSVSSSKAYLICSNSGLVPIAYTVVATDIDSSGGQQVWDPVGTLTRTVNWTTTNNSNSTRSYTW